MKEFLTDLLVVWKERVKNPFIGSFVISLIIYNWRPILFILFSNETIENKIIVINSEYSDYKAIVYPLLLSFIYSISLPFVNWIIDVATNSINSTRTEYKHDKTLSDYDNKIQIAKKNREIAVINAGTSEVETLTIEKEELAKKNSEQKELYNEKILSKEKENILLDQIINNQKNENQASQNLANHYRRISQPNREEINTLYDQLGRDLIYEFKLFCDSAIYDKPNAQYDRQYITRYIENNLILELKYGSLPVQYSFTKLGFEIYLDASKN